MYQLRPYQQECHDATIRSICTSSGHPLVVLPTGAGKSVNIAKMVEECTTGGGRVLVLSHVKEILQQNYDKIKAMLPTVDVGIYSASLGERKANSQVVVGAIQSVYDKACELGRFDLCIVDEAHLISTADANDETMYHQYMKKQEVINPEVRWIGYTATPYRMNGGPIFGPNRMFSHVCYEVEVNKLIEDGYLCPLVSKEAASFSDKNCKLVGGEFNLQWLASMMNSKEKVEHAVKEILARTSNRHSVLIFCVDVQHCYDVAVEIERQQNNNVNLLQLVTGEGPRLGSAAVITGNTDQVIRDGAIEMFRDQQIKYLVNCQVLTTGMDAPNVDCVVMLRPTMSASLYVQMVGRGFRPHQSKTECLVLDFAGNIHRHGPINDISVEGKPKHAKPGQGPTKECRICQCLVPIQSKACPHCGNEFEFDEAELKHNITPDQSVNILHGGPIDTEYDVKDVQFRMWSKKSDPTKPPSMRVDYICGLSTVFSEWVCFEHDGFAGSKARQWWFQHSALPIPKSTEEAVTIANGQGVAIPDKIVVREKPGVKYTEIVQRTISQAKPKTFDPLLASVDSKPWGIRSDPTKKHKNLNPTKQFIWEDEPVSQAIDESDEVPF